MCLLFLCGIQMHYSQYFCVLNVCVLLFTVMFMLLSSDDHVPYSVKHVVLLSINPFKV